jgi:hypothetical protein
LTDFDVDRHYRVPAPTPDSGGGGGGTTSETQQWFIYRTYEGLFIPGGTDKHGTLRGTSVRTVFLDN